MQLHLNDGSTFDADELRSGDEVLVMLYANDVIMLRKEGRMTDITPGQFKAVFHRLDHKRADNMVGEE